MSVIIDAGADSDSIFLYRGSYTSASDLGLSTEVSEMVRDLRANFEECKVKGPKFNRLLQGFRLRLLITNALINSGYEVEYEGATEVR